MQKLHLGCGENYLEGYINIDLPVEHHPTMKVRADVYADIRTLTYSDNSVDEIRTHHLLEHFSRTESLRLLLQWRKWLKPGGLLYIETPDFENAIKAFLQAQLPQKFKIARHIFGSHESDWAFHKDFWSQEKFAFILDILGFEKCEFRQETVYTSKMLPDRFSHIIQKIAPDMADALHNISLRAYKSNISIDEVAAVRKILSKSLLGKEDNILDVWMKEFAGD